MKQILRSLDIGTNEKKKKGGEMDEEAYHTGADEAFPRP